MRYKNWFYEEREKNETLAQELAAVKKSHGKLEKENELLTKQLLGERKTDPYCKKCEHGIDFGYGRYLCDLNVTCKNFQVKD